jgi:hypothetical protein
VAVDKHEREPAAVALCRPEGHGSGGTAPRPIREPRVEYTAAGLFKARSPWAADDDAFLELASVVATTAADMAAVAEASQLDAAYGRLDAGPMLREATKRAARAPTAALTARNAHTP